MSLMNRLAAWSTSNQPLWTNHTGQCYSSQCGCCQSVSAETTRQIEWIINVKMLADSVLFLFMTVEHLDPEVLVSICSKHNHNQLSPCKNENLSITSSQSVYLMTCRSDAHLSQDWTKNCLKQMKTVLHWQIRYYCVDTCGFVKFEISFWWHRSIWNGLRWQRVFDWWSVRLTSWRESVAFSKSRSSISRKVWLISRPNLNWNRHSLKANNYFHSVCYALISYYGSFSLDVGGPMSVYVG